MAMHSLRLDSVFSALADPTRRAMVERLSRGAASITELATGFALSQPAISKHVKVLESSGLLHRTISGRTHLCRLDPDAILAASQWCDQQRRFWNATFDRLDAMLRDDAPQPPPAPRRVAQRKRTS